GYRGMQGDNGYVLHVHELRCAPWQPKTRTAGVPARAVRAFAEKTAPGQSIGDACLDGRLGTRLRGRAGNYLHRLADIACTALSDRPLAASSGGALWERPLAANAGEAPPTPKTPPEDAE